VEHDEAMRMIRAITTAFDGHDLDGIMGHFADDAVFEGPRGPHAWGQRFVGRDEVRKAFAGRFSGIPDIRYVDEGHFVDGDRGASEWTLSGTMATGERIEVRGCDLWTFRDGKVAKKDSFWKIRTD
jgi:ketosteroid isomerase-like protein